jgi:hypothetical protein
MKLVDFTVGMFLIIYIGVFCYQAGYNKASEATPDTHFWIDNTKVYIDSEIYPRDIYNEHGEVVGSNVRIVTDRGDSYIEFLDTDYATWEEDLNSWVMAFRKGDGTWN